ncbi:hypothetical protein ILYODFUR_028840 [Ilyodon furcidens]|uniref:Uncharacterized protein n=1 Tax=Ilyodon furcidens TaxID=33524 RepID=A0ABV0VKR6_9TELE
MKNCFQGKVAPQGAYVLTSGFTITLWCTTKTTMHGLVFYFEGICQPTSGERRSADLSSRLKTINEK